MYEVRRANNRVTITKGRDHIVFDAADTAYIVYLKNDEQVVSLVKDLADPDLLLALASAVFLRE